MSTTKNKKKGKQQVELIETDPNRAISLVRSAIDAGHRVDSALKDMAVLMKQSNQFDEAFEAIISYRHLCPRDSLESVDNLLLELSKRVGRIEEVIEMHQSELNQIDETTTGSFQQEKSRILGNLASAYKLQENYSKAEEHYRKALFLEPDPNKQRDLEICLKHMNKLPEAMSLLETVRASSHNKPFECVHQMPTELDQQSPIRNDAVLCSPQQQLSPCGWKRVVFPAGSVVGFQRGTPLIYCTESRIQCLDSTDVLYTWPPRSIHVPPSRILTMKDPVSVAPSTVDKKELERLEERMEELKAEHYRSDKKASTYGKFGKFGCFLVASFMAGNAFVWNTRDLTSCTILIILEGIAIYFFSQYHNQLVNLNKERHQMLQEFMDVWKKLTLDNTCPLGCLPENHDVYLLRLYIVSLTVYAVMMLIELITHFM